MTALITIVWKFPDGKTPLAAQKGSFTVEPVQGWVAGDARVSKVQTTHQVKDGTATLRVPDDTARVWKFRHSPIASGAWTDYKLVPPGEPDTETPIQYNELVSVDPDTLSPTPDVLQDALAVMSAETVTAGTVVGGDLILTRGDGATVNAGHVEGMPGRPGASAYDIAVAGGFVGTESEWLASLGNLQITDNGTTITIGIRA